MKESLGLKEKIDIILASDIIYLAKSFTDIVECYLELATPNHTKILMASTDHGNLSVFKAKLAEYENLKVSYIDQKYLDPEYVD